MNLKGNATLSVNGNGTNQFQSRAGHHQVFLSTPLYPKNMNGPGHRVLIIYRDPPLQSRKPRIPMPILHFVGIIHCIQIAVAQAHQLVLLGITLMRQSKRLYTREKGIGTLRAPSGTNIQAIRNQVHLLQGVSPRYHHHRHRRTTDESELVVGSLTHLEILLRVASQGNKTPYDWTLPVLLRLYET